MLINLSQQKYAYKSLRHCTTEKLWHTEGVCVAVNEGYALNDLFWVQARMHNLFNVLKLWLSGRV